ncbi:Uncharacterized protein APZ42_031453 [Daphnia magna]|uniref:Uncharacterized protein n=1 Tax=Daphnia magna TaxID=35525 RepID=A0A164MUM9_9CRUS|nr:Uncharacterized protein APZ42_031453 [Daphnia magna]
MTMNIKSITSSIPLDTANVYFDSPSSLAFASTSTSADVPVYSTSSCTNDNETVEDACALGKEKKMDIDSVNSFLNPADKGDVPSSALEYPSTSTSAESTLDDLGADTFIL